MSEQIRIAALKSQLSKHLRAAEGGEVIDVMDRARVIARIVPVDRPELASGAGLETTPAVRPFSAVRGVRLPKLKLAVGSLAMLADDRGTR